MESDILKDKKIRVIRRLLSDVIIIVTGGIILLLFREIGDPYKRGFFCDDQSLNHPYKESTVPSSVLYGVGFAVGAILMIAIEAIHVYRLEISFDIQIYGKLLTVLKNIYLALVPFVFGAVIEHITTDIGKYSVGRLRPHFFSVCNLNYSTINCNAGYIEHFMCHNEDENKIREVRLSFPSGHSSFASYVAVYLIIYLQQRMTFVFDSLLRAALQMVLFSIAWYTCLSRISDYKHHPTDVLGGAVIGTLSAILVAYGVSDLFQMKLVTGVKREPLTKYRSTSNSGEEQTTPSIQTNL